MSTSNNRIEPAANPDIELLLSTVGQKKLFMAVCGTIAELKKKLDALKDLYARTSRASNTNEILELLTNDVLDQLPGLAYLVKNPDDKYWHANILLVIQQELHRVGNLWEYMDGEFGDWEFGDWEFGDWEFGDWEFGDWEFGDDKRLLDKLIGIRDQEILVLIKQKISR